MKKNITQTKQLFLLSKQFCFIVIISMLARVQVIAQASTYAYSTATGVSLTAMGSPTTLIGANVDDNVSAVTNIGFNFTFAGTTYTQFAVSSNALVTLGGTTNGLAINATASAIYYPTLMPWWDDLVTRGAGVRCQVSGTAPNRQLTIQWEVVNYISTGSPATTDKTFQVQLFETTNIVRFVYSAGANPGSASVGIASLATNFNCVNTNTNTNNIVTAQDGNNVWPGSGRAYTFTPASTITSFTPNNGCSSGGTSVVITGTNFTGATAVRFNGVNAASYVVNSATQITAVSPASVTTGLITVVTPSGTANSALNFASVPFGAAVASNTGGGCGGASLSLTASGLAPGGGGYTLNGTSQYLVTPNLYTAANFPNTGVTLEVWFRPNAAGVIIAEQGTATPNSIWYDTQIEVLSTGEVRVRVWNLASVSLGTVAFGTWNHAVVRFNPTGNVLDGLLNGAPTTTTISGTARSTPFPANGLFYAVGATCATNLGSGAFFNGQVDEFRVWNTALSNANIANWMRREVAASHPNYANLIAYYKMNGNLNDSKNAYTLTAVAAPTATASNYYTYTWTGTNAPAASTNETQTLTLPASPSFPLTYSVVATAAGLCNSTSASTVNSAGAASVAPTAASTSVSSYCSASVPANITLTATGGSAGAGASIRWYSGSCGGTLVGTGSPLTITAPTSTTIYYARYEGCSNTTTCASTTVTVVPSPANPGFGTNAWNVIVYNAGDNAGGSGAWTSNYAGYYTISSLNFDTRIGQTYSTAESWANTGSPSSAVGYNGCTVGADNHSYVFKRQGVGAGVCGTYNINILEHDDIAILKINGVEVWRHNGCCDVHNNIWTGFLDGSSQIELYISEGGGNSDAAISFTPVTTSATLSSTSPTSCGANGTVTISNPQGVNCNILTTSFSSTPAGSTLYGSASIASEECLLTPATNSLYGTWAITPSIRPDYFQANFSMYIGGGTGADGMSFNYGGFTPTATTGGEAGFGAGLTVSFDTYDGLNPNPQVFVFYNGALVSSNTLGAYNFRTASYLPVAITVNSLSQLTLSINGTTIFNNVALPVAYTVANKSSWIYAFSGRTGAVNDIHKIDELNLYALNYAEYSINGLSWQTSGVFNVPAGTYTPQARSRCATTCVTSLGSITVTDPPAPQGTLSSNGSYCAPQLIFTASAGTGPFTLVYNDGVANRTASSVVSGTAFNTFTSPIISATTYTLVSVTGANACVRSSGFTGASTSITIPTITGTTTVCVGGTTDLAATAAADWTAPTGGTITTLGNDYIHTFNSSGTFATAQTISNVRLLVIGGGGGGGGNGGGGGGAGAYINNTGQTLTGSNTVVVGNGGAATATSSIPGSNGANSSFGAVVAAGGGGGASRDGGGGGQNGGSGGGGGGSTIEVASVSGSGGTSIDGTYTSGAPINISVPALPAGAVVTSIITQITYTANSPSYMSEFRVEVTPPTAIGAAQSDIQVSTTATAGTVTNATFGTYASNNPAGTWSFRFRETFDDAGTDANVSNITITINYASRYLGGAGLASQGSNGGNGTTPDPGCNAAGGGGGGAGGVGTAATSNLAGNGGAGVQNNITGTNLFYAAGGGGGTTNYSGCGGAASWTNGTGGSGIGGNGESTNGATNTGSGGGAERAGGSGVVIVRYTAPRWTSSNTAVATVNQWTGLVTGVASGTSTITYTNPAGCSTTTTVTVGGSANVILAPSDQLGIASSCDDGVWTYYESTSNPGKYVFAINWNPNGGVVGNASRKSAAVVHINKATAPTGTAPTPTPVTFVSGGASPGYYRCADASTSQATFAMQRYWNVNVGGGALPEPVNVRFFFDPLEYDAVVNAANAWSLANGGFVEGPRWFKTVAATDGVNNTWNPGSDMNPVRVEHSGWVTDLNSLVSGYNFENGVRYVQFDGISSFSGGTLAVGVGNGTSLPLELLSFTGNKEDTYNHLDWITAQERNTSHFEVQRSSDAIHFITIGTLTAAGYSTVEETYDFNDNAPLAGNNYYRLKMVDADGVASMSNIINLNRPTDYVSLTNLYPNPAKTIVHFELYSPSQEDISLKVLDILGREVFSSNINLQEGLNTNTLDVSQFTPGLYFLNVTCCGGKVITYKFTCDAD